LGPQQNIKITKVLKDIGVGGCGKRALIFPTLEDRRYLDFRQGLELDLSSKLYAFAGVPFNIYLLLCQRRSSLQVYNK